MEYYNYQSKCHNCFEDVAEDRLFEHLALKTCHTKCNICHQEVESVNEWIAQDHNNEEMRRHQGTSQCKANLVKNYFCKKCHLQFANEEEFINHSSLPCQIQCGHCGGIFCRTKTRNIHAQHCLGLSITCQHCLQTFAGMDRKEKYLQHLPCDLVLQCVICQVKFVGNEATKRYTKHYKKGQHTTTCDLCESAIVGVNLQKELQRHNLINHPELMANEEATNHGLKAECGKCDVNFEEFESNKWKLLKEHEDIGCVDHRFPGRIYKCVLCGIKMNAKKSLHKLRDLKRHYQRGCSSKLKCPMCQQEFQGEHKTRDFTRHIKNGCNKKRNISDVTCDACGETFHGKRKKRDLARHQKLNVCHLVTAEVAISDTETENTGERNDLSLEGNGNEAIDDNDLQENVVMDLSHREHEDVEGLPLEGNGNETVDDNDVQGNQFMDMSHGDHDDIEGLSLEGDGNETVDANDVQENVVMDLSHGGHDDIEGNNTEEALVIHDEVSRSVGDISDIDEDVGLGEDYLDDPAEMSGDMVDIFDFAEEVPEVPEDHEVDEVRLEEVQGPQMLDKLWSLMPDHKSLDWADENKLPWKPKKAVDTADWTFDRYHLVR